MAWTDWIEGFRRREFSGFQHKTRPRRRRSSRRERHRRSVLLETLEPRLLLAMTHEIESNDSLALATGLALTQDPSGFFSGLGLGAISPGSDVDYWWFRAQVGDRVTVAGDGGLNANSIVVELRDSNDVVLGSASDNAGRPQLTNFGISSAGTYYVRTRTRDGGASRPGTSSRSAVRRWTS